MKNRNEIKVILATLGFIRKEERWNKNSVYHEKCDLQADKLTLGCAIEKAQLKIRGKLQSRSKEMRVLRRTIYFNFFWRAGLRPITYFNSNKRTKHKDIIDILQMVLQKLDN